MNRQTFLLLLDKYLDGSASPVECSLLEEYYNRLDKIGVFDLSETEEQALHDAMLNNINRQIAGKVIPMKPGRGRVLWYAAASILVFLSLGLYFYINRIRRTPPVTQTYANDIGPGADKTTLTLADGRKIVLTDALNGKIAQQGSEIVNKTAGGEVVYEASKSGTGNGEANPKFGIQCNTLETSIGGQTHITLADGTQVWLNAASSLKYPTVFNGNNRKVELTGEAYFEVAHNAKQPFTVTTATETVQDIGTHFNINAYTDEKVVKTTLLEGAVKVSQISMHSSQLLKPGQQSLIQSPDSYRDNNSIIVKEVDPEEAVAWKNGNFQFDNADITTVMRQLVRWYNVDIKYEGAVPRVHYSGTVPRRSNISAVLNMLRETGHTNFKIEGRTVTVLK